MRETSFSLSKAVLMLLMISFIAINLAQKNYLFADDSNEINIENNQKNPIINKIKISGNKQIEKAVILSRQPYRIGQEFDESRRREATNNIYKIGAFKQVEIYKKKIAPNKINLYIELQEKSILGKIEIKGCKAISRKKIVGDLKLDKLTTMDQETLEAITKSIKKIYAEENYHMVEIDPEITNDPEVPGKVNAIFNIKEGAKSSIARIYFKGNKKVPDRKLRNMIFTREIWLLSFMDEAGKYKEDEIEMDKHRIEYLYKDLGYIQAVVPKFDVKFSKNKSDISITFYIKEGEKYFIKSISVTGDGTFSEKELKEEITLEENTPYSQSKVIESINRLKDLLGKKGFIYADVYPQMKFDENNKTVDITFVSEKGRPLYVNAINITGNRVTRDKVIRRKIELSEGDLITRQKLAKSQNNIEYLSFFEKDGVSWKIHRISETLADLELNVVEAKTGNLQGGLTYGSEKGASRPSLRGRVSLEKRNLFGKGWDSAFMMEANRHQVKKLQASFLDPNIFDSDVSVALNAYRNWEEYDRWQNVNKTPLEKIIGGSARFGFLLPKIDNDLQFLFEIGTEYIKNNNPIAEGEGSSLFEPIVRRTYREGLLTWLSLDLIKDTRNHQVYPNKGYKISLSTKTAPSQINREYSFFKSELEGSWYTPLIGQDNLVLVLHGRIGAVHTIGGTSSKTSRKKVIPYKELFHMGGQTTVRGFLWGSIGPAWINNDPLGGRYAVQFNTELIFPLMPDYSMKAHLFYDAGAGWSTPKDCIPDTKFIKRDNFNIRHSVGFGLNILKPVPAKVDWGYKLDRDKSSNESPHEFHLSMNYAW